KCNIAYTGTHDNNTTLGWVYELNDGARDFALKYSGFSGAGWGAGGPQCASVKSIMKTVIASSAVLAILPVQDMLGYGGDTRMNIPGKPDGNWRFRLPFELMMTVDRDFFLDKNNTYGRNNPGIK
ncbi:MAG: 4-alpha-glucanotransferase, partial [Clostridia bacterium]|nr:4-alpha-glucanotransferase [Clostridia bacterium]